MATSSAPRRARSGPRAGLPACRHEESVGSARATYFKTVRFVIDPPEPLKILWLVEVPVADAVTCGFSEARNWACSSSDPSIDLASTIEALGTFVDPTTAKCHHLSYVRTTEELHDKLTSFAHARDVRENWLDDVWHAGTQSEPRGPPPDAPIGVQAHRLTGAARDARRCGGSRSRRATRSY